MVVELFNSSLEIGSWINSATNNVTGNIFLTLLLLTLFILLIAILFKTPIVLVFAFILPLLIVFGEVDTTNTFYAIIGIIVIIVGWLLAKVFFSYR